MFSLCLLKTQFLNGRIEKCNYLQWNIFGKWKHIHIRIGKQAEYFHCIIRFLLCAMTKLTSSERYASSLLRCSTGFIPVKSVRYFFDLTVAIGFSQRLSDRIEYTYSPVLTSLPQLQFQAADVATLIIKICADCNILRSTKNAFCLHMIDGLIFHNI